MGLLRKRTSKSSLRAKDAKDESRLPSPPPQLPPLPAHIRRSESTNPKKAPVSDATSSLRGGTRRRSRSLWGASDARAAGITTVSGLQRRDSFGSAPKSRPQTLADQPWRSREAWAALHTSNPVVAELTHPSAPNAAVPGWRNRGGGGFFGGEMTESESVGIYRTRSRMSEAEPRTSRREAPPPMPTPTPQARNPKRIPDLIPSRRNERDAETPDLAKSPSPSPETAPSVRSIESSSAHAYAVAAGIASRTDLPPTAAESYASLTSTPLPQANASYRLAPSPTPALTPSASPHIGGRRPSHGSPATPNVLLTPKSTVQTTLADSRNTPWGAASRSTTPLQRINSSSSIASADAVTAPSSAVPKAPVRLPAPAPANPTGSEDSHQLARPGRAEHYIERHASLKDSHPPAKASRAPAPVPEVGEAGPDFTRSPSTPGASPAGPALYGGVVPGAWPQAGKSRPPAQKGTNARERAPSQSAPSSGPAPPRPSRDPSRLEQAASTQGQSASGQSVPVTTSAIQRAVNAWRYKNVGKPEGLGLLPSESASRQPAPASRGQPMPQHSRNRSANSSGSSSERPREKFEMAPEWPAETQDSFTESHQWEDAYESYYLEDKNDSSAEVSPAKEGERDNLIEPPVQTVHPSNVMQSHVQMAARIRTKSGAAEPTQHYQLPQQQRHVDLQPQLEAAERTRTVSQSKVPRSQPSRTPPAPTQRLPQSPPPEEAVSRGPMRLPQSSASGPMRLPPPGQMRLQSPPQSILRNPQSPPDRRQAPPSHHQHPQHPQPQHPQHPQHSQHSQHPHHPHPHQQPQSSGQFPMPPNRQWTFPQPSVQGRPPHPQQFIPPGHHRQTSGPRPPYPPGARPYPPNGAPARPYPPHGAPQHQHAPQGYPQYRPARPYPPGHARPPQQGQPQYHPAATGRLPQQMYHSEQPRGTTPPDQSMQGLSIATVNMQVPQVLKSPKVPQSVAQGGWI